MVLDTKLLFIWCMSLLVIPKFSKGCIQSEGQALLNFKKGLEDQANLLSSWTIGRGDCCRWRGVRCDNQTGHVVMLDLGHVIVGELDGFGSRIRGKISSSLLDLPFLSHLDLSENSFENFPDFIGSLSKLIYLNLSSNDIVGTIPDQIGNLSMLQTLDLSGNSGIKAKNFKWLTRLTSLTTLNMSDINFLGALDWLQAIITHPSLSTLEFSSCQFPDVNHSSLSNISASNSLVVLSLFDNTHNISLQSWLPNISNALAHLTIEDDAQLKGSIPSFFGDMVSLVYLDLSNNQLEGPIPSFFGDMVSLVHLDLSNNQLEGPIPSFFGDMVSLVHLDLSNNQLEGGIPPSFQNLRSLNSLYLSDNNLSEPLPYILQNLRSSRNSMKILSLHSNKITGSIPDITDFTGLIELYVDHNLLDGSFPLSFQHSSRLEILNAEENKLVGAFPELMKFPSLIELHLANNELNGTLGESIGMLSNLTVLDVSGNQPKGSLSEVHFSDLYKLRELDLSYNSLAMDVSSNWDPTFQLDMIKLSSCKLGPQFPHWIRSQKKFSHLDIFNSNIADTIPKWFWNLPPTLRYLNLSFNNISGNVPNLSSHFYMFPAVDFSSNLFYGPIPLFLFNSTVLNLSRNMFFGSLSFLCTVRGAALNYLDLSNNRLSGGLTDCWGRLQQMVILNLENNNFSGRIPSSLGSLLSLETMSLRNNSLTGELPSTWESSYLKLLDLGENKLTGNISSLFGQSLKGLIVLRLRSNEFYGNIPSELCHLNSIQLLDLSFNHLSGSIPTCLNNLTVMARNQTSSNEISHVYFYSYIYWNVNFGWATNYYAHYVDHALVDWRGNEQQYEKTLGLVKVIDLSSNHLIGSIPREVTSLLGIKSLNFSRNNLKGTIPGDIGQLKALESLDLSSNKLSGRIPSSLADITFLAKLDLSNNGLTGRIPTSTQLQSFDASAYQGNPGLCGRPLPNDCVTIQDPYPPCIGDDGEWFYREWLYAGIWVGFPVGFWGFCGPLIISKSWRHKYFQFLETASAFFYFKIIRKLVKQASKTTTP